MSYSNTFLRDFVPVFIGIVKELRIPPEELVVEVVDEESARYSVFETADVRDALEQIAPDLNFLTIYTERPAYFYNFAETMYEENGLIITMLPKKCFGRAHRCDNQVTCIGKYGQRETGKTLVLDFEWEGGRLRKALCAGKYYVPIHKKPWEKRANLDIVVPMGYNTVIVKGVPNRGRKPGRDRLEEAFYSE